MFPTELRMILNRMGNRYRGLSSQWDYSDGSDTLDCVTMKTNVDILLTAFGIYRTVDKVTYKVTIRNVHRRYIQDEILSMTEATINSDGSNEVAFGNPVNILATLLVPIVTNYRRVILTDIATLVVAN